MDSNGNVREPKSDHDPVGFEECEYFFDHEFCNAVTKDREENLIRQMRRDRYCENERRDLCCYLCSFQKSCTISCNYLLKPQSTPALAEYEVKYLGRVEIKGRLLLCPEKIVFSPEVESAEKTEVPTIRIIDARLASEKEISALRIWLVGPVLGTLWKKEHKILLIDFNDEVGIIQHFAFEGEFMEDAIDELYDIRRERKQRKMENAYAQPTLKTPNYTAGWQCPRCGRTNTPKAKFCTRCGEWRT